MATKKKRVHLLSAVNAANVSKSGAKYVIRDVCGAVDDIVMNSTLYPADQLAAGAPTMEGKIAPAGHPKNADGTFISATNADALLTSFIGAVCKNARHEGGRTLVDIHVNEAQAKGHPDGQRLIDRLDAAIAGTNADPIHVSTGLLLVPVTANGESRGKKYTRIATQLQYDHLAILLNEKGAGTPAEGVGMFLNADGAQEEVEVVEVNADPVDQRGAGLLAKLQGWVQRLVGNGTDLSFDQIQSGLYALLPEGAWLREVFDRYCIWCDRDNNLFQQSYSIAADGSLAFAGQPQAVKRQVEYVPITNQEKGDLVKDQILAALNAAGVITAGLDDTQLLASYNTLARKPAEDKLAAANARITALEGEKTAAENAERDKLATELAVNSSLTADDFKAMPVARLRELKAKAAPVVVGNSGGSQADEFADYNLNDVK
ncbi:hypothetical protein [Pseudacidovorax intermedius]|uniref:hypothetical protein n=1 Tax=Pseudacidovorax intermedius TaxID=433924 RepID=UPI000734D580|nr:hypothetical protein [Pseudacidovorax intermedius]